MSFGCMFTLPTIIHRYWRLFHGRRQVTNGCPKRNHADLGTENTYIRQMEIFLRDDHGNAFAQRSFIYGSSHHNQRIDSWWSFLRKYCTQHWMNIFQDLQGTNMYTGDFLDKNLIKFCFMKLIKVVIFCVVYAIHTYHLSYVYPCRPMVRYDSSFINCYRKSLMNSPTTKLIRLYLSLSSRKNLITWFMLSDHHETRCLQVESQ